MFDYITLCRLSFERWEGPVVSSPLFGHSRPTADLLQNARPRPEIMKWTVPACSTLDCKVMA